MKFFLLLFFLLFTLTNCNKHKSVLICGDHICINKAEAEQYFEENLTIEVKIIERKKVNNFDLIELNLNENNEGKREITLQAKNKPLENLKILSNKEKIKIKEDIKIKKKIRKSLKKSLTKKEI
jgi:hypothetical protein